MLKTIAIVISVIFSSIALHLPNRHTHYTVTSSDLKTTSNQAVTSLTNLNTSLAATLASLNPYNQDDRILKLETAIIQARQTLLGIYNQTTLPLSSSTYYCQQLSPSQTTAINSSLANITQALNTINQIYPINDPTNPTKLTSPQLSSTLAAINTTLQQPGTTILTAPTEVNQANLAAANNWTLGNGNLSTLASNYATAPNQNGQTCPVDKPYVNAQNTCVACIGYFDLTSKICTTCNKFDTINHVCLDLVQPANPIQPGTNTTTTTITTTTTTNTTSPATNPTNTPTTTTNTTTNPTTPPTTTNTTVPTTNPTTNSTTPTSPPVQPIQRITNLQNPTGLLLPVTKTLPEYTKQISNIGTNVVPCPSTTPFFDGTECISCPSGQYFSVQIRTCQTCASGYVYSLITYHCEKISYYSSLTSPTWTTIAKSPEQIQQQATQNSTAHNAQPCPPTHPFFNGAICINCTAPTPYFSFDTGQCTSCTAGTVFSSNLHSCIVAQTGQTNLASPNLLLDGHPLNEWKSYYYGNQTANPQLTDCPSNRPYFDGISCVACVAPTPLFSMLHRVCTACASGTTYDNTVRECMSSSGNIVTQSPTLAKMAAGIFA